MPSLTRHGNPGARALLPPQILAPWRRGAPGVLFGIRRRNARHAKTPRRHWEGAAAADRERRAALDAVAHSTRESGSTRAAWTRGRRCHGCPHKLAPWRRGAPGVLFGIRRRNAPGVLFGIR